jgi:hypothetical protein
MNEQSVSERRSERASKKRTTTTTNKRNTAAEREEPVTKASKQARRRRRAYSTHAYAHQKGRQRARREERKRKRREQTKQTKQTSAQRHTTTISAPSEQVSNSPSNVPMRVKSQDKRDETSETRLKAIKKLGENKKRRIFRVS